MAADQYVYFLKPVASSGPIKIGTSSGPIGRLETYSSWSPVALEIVATVPGSLALERRIHETFAYAHSHLEWFHPVDDLLKGIHALQAGASVEDAFDLSKKTGSIRKKSHRIKARFTPQYRERLSYHHSFIRWQQKLWRTPHEYAVPKAASALMANEVSQQWLTDAERQFLADELSKLKAFVKAKLRPDIFGKAQ